MSDFQRIMVGLFALLVVVILLLSSLSTGKEALRNISDGTGTYVSCSLAICPQATPATTGQRRK